MSENSIVDYTGDHIAGGVHKRSARRRISGSWLPTLEPLVIKWDTEPISESLRYTYDSYLTMQVPLDGTQDSEQLTVYLYYVKHASHAHWHTLTCKKVCA